MSEETGDSLFRAEGTGPGSQRHGHSGSKPSFQTQAKRKVFKLTFTSVAKTSPNPGRAQRVPVFIPTAVFPRDAGCSQCSNGCGTTGASHRGCTGGKAGWSADTNAFGCFTSGYRHSHLFHHCRLLRPGKPQFLPDIAGYFGVGPEPSYLDAVRFFSVVSACGSPSSSSGNPIRHGGQQS